MATTNQEGEMKPLAGDCAHTWVDQPSPYRVAQVCVVCKLFRYKASVTSDWEYRAPIPFAVAESQSSDPPADS